MSEPLATIKDANGTRVRPEPFHPGVWCGCEGTALFIGLRPNEKLHPNVRAGTPVKVVSVDLDAGELELSEPIYGRGLSVWFDMEEHARMYPEIAHLLRVK